MLLRQGYGLQGAGRAAGSAAGAPTTLLTAQPSRPGRRSSRRAATAVPRATAAPADAAAAAAAAADAAAGRGRGAGRPRGRKATRKKAPNEDRLEEGQPELPVPVDYQQTVRHSFTIGGVGLHGGEHAVVRVRPAFAGEGRYFVRVPAGTNAPRFAFKEDRVDGDAAVPLEEAAALALNPPADEALEEARVEWFRAYLLAQRDDGYVGTFAEWTDEQVVEGKLGAKERLRLLGVDDGAADASPDDVPLPDPNAPPERPEPLDPADPTVVMALVTSVSELGLPFTRLGEADARVDRPELLLAALEACGVDNCRIEVEGGHELPVLDNSALGWAIEVQVAGLQPAPLRADAPPPADAGMVSALDQGGGGSGGGASVVRRELFKPSQAVGVQDDEGWVSFFPSDYARLTIGVDHARTAPVIGSQWLTWRPLDNDLHFRYALAPARGYVESVEALFELRRRGFVKAGAENLFNVADGERWWDVNMVRMTHDEPARHALAVLVGNLSLLGVAGASGLPVGHVTAFNASPSLQLQFVRQLLEALEEDDVVPFTDALDEQAAWIAARDSAVSGQVPPAMAALLSSGGDGADGDAGGDAGGGSRRRDTLSSIGTLPPQAPLPPEEDEEDAAFYDEDEDDDEGEDEGEQQQQSPQRR